MLNSCKNKIVKVSMANIGIKFQYRNFSSLKIKNLTLRPTVRIDAQHISTRKGCQPHQACAETRVSFLL